MGCQALTGVLTLALCAVLSQTSLKAADSPVPPPPKWEVFGGLQGGVRPDAVGPGVAGFVGVNRALTSWLRPELLLGLGYYGTPNDLLTVIRIGARIEWPTEGRLRPYVWLAFAHNHETPIDAAKANPIGTVLGLSESGVVHRSGVDTGLGLAYELPRRAKDRMAGRIGVRLTVTHFVGAGPPRYVDLAVTMGLCF